MDIVIDVCKSIQSKNTALIQEALKNAENLFTKNTDLKTIRDVQGILFPSLVHIVTGNFEKCVKVSCLKVIKAVSVLKYCRISREVEILCEHILLYVIYQEEDLEIPALSILMNILQNEQLLKSLETRFRDFLRFEEAVRERGIDDSFSFLYTDILILLYNHTGSKLHPSLSSKKLQQIKVGLEERNQNIIEATIDLFEASPQFMKTAKSDSQLKKEALEYCCLPKMKLENCLKLLEVDFFSPRDVLELLESFPVKRETKITRFLMLELVTKKEPGLMDADLIRSIVSEFESDATIQEYIGLASLLTALAEQETLQPILKEKLPVKSISSLLHRMLEDYSSHPLDEGLCNVIISLILLMATMSEGSALFYSEFSKLMTERKIMDALACGLLVGGSCIKHAVLKITSFPGFQREEFCLKFEEKQSIVTGRTCEDSQNLSLSTFLYSPELRDINMILDHIKEKISTHPSASELSDIYELRLNSLERHIKYLEGFLEESTATNRMLLKKEKEISSRQLEKLVCMQNRLMLKEGELKSVEERLAETIDRLTELEEKKEEVQKISMKEISFLRNQVSHLTDMLALKEEGLNRALAEVNSLSGEVVTVTKNEEKKRQKLERAFSEEKASFVSNLKELTKELETEREKNSQLTLERLNLLEKAKTSEEELVSLRRLKQVLSEQLNYRS